MPCIVGNPNVHCSIGNSARSVPNLSHINPINTNPISVRSILILFTHLSLSLRSGLFSSAFRTKLVNRIFFCHVRATWPSHFTRLDLVNLMESGEISKRWRPLIDATLSCNCAHCLLDVSFAQDAIGGDSWYWRTADKGWFSSLVFEREAVIALNWKAIGT